MAQQKVNNKIVASTVDALTFIDNKFIELIGEFGPVELLKPADSYLLGSIRTAQASCNYLSGIANDLDKQVNKASKAKTTELKPED
jgi:hypothetical protein